MKKGYPHPQNKTKVTVINNEIAILKGKKSVQAILKEKRRTQENSLLARQKRKSRLRRNLERRGKRALGKLGVRVSKGWPKGLKPK